MIYLSRHIIQVLFLSSFLLVVLASSSSDVSVPDSSEGQSEAVQGRVQIPVEKMQPAIGGIGARVVNGTDVPPNTYPWYTRLTFRNRRQTICGGLLVAPDYVLTAAHCESRAPYTAQVGAFCEPFEGGDNCEQDMEEFGTLEFIRHPDYNPFSLDNDFALIRLDGNSTVQPVMIDSGTFSPTYTEEKKLWGIGKSIPFREKPTFYQTPRDSQQ